eukprot:4043570-Pleurochrysis_carterae.AAC.1
MHTHTQCLPPVPLLAPPSSLPFHRRLPESTQTATYKRGDDMRTCVSERTHIERAHKEGRGRDWSERCERCEGQWGTEQHRRDHGAA